MVCQLEYLLEFILLLVCESTLSTFDQASSILGYSGHGVEIGISNSRK